MRRQSMHCIYFLAQIRTSYETRTLGTLKADLPRIYHNQVGGTPKSQVHVLACFHILACFTDSQDKDKTRGAFTRLDLGGKSCDILL